MDNNLNRKQKINFLINKGYSKSYLEHIADDYQINHLFDSEDDSKICPNCEQQFNGIECNHCGFDTRFDPNWS